MYKRWIIWLVVVALIVATVGCVSSKTETTKKEIPKQQTGEQAQKESPTQKETPDEFPSKPITNIVSWKAGGGNDILARILGEALQRNFGISQIVVNKPGAGAEIGFAELQRAKPDGYTVGMTSVPTLLTTYIDRKIKGMTPQYDWRQLQPVIGIVKDARTLAVSASSKFKTIQDLIDYGKKNPGKLRIGHGGVGTIAHVTVVDFADLAGIKITEVPYDGTSPQMTALMGGEIDAACPGVGESWDLYNAGKIRYLVVFDDERWDKLPDVPTAKEIGINAVHTVIRGISVPKGVPQERVKKLHDIYKKASEDPKTRKAIGANRPIYLPGDEYRKAIETMYEKYDKLLRRIKK